MPLTRTPRLIGGAVGLAALAGSLLTPTAALAAGPLALDSGHIDAFAVSATGDALSLALQEDVTGSHVKHVPEDVVLKVKQSAYTDQLPAGYPGAPSGYVLPLSQNADLIWPGWDTSGTQGAAYSDVTIDIAKVEGPGDVFLYGLGSFGAVTPLLEGGSTQLPGSIHVPKPTHSHAQWTFTKAGSYQLTVAASAKNADGTKSIASDTHVYSFEVGDTEPQPTTVTLSGGKTSYTADEQISLTATVAPPSSHDHWHWFSRAPGGEWAVVPGQATSSLALTAAADLDGHELIARLYGDDHAVIAESAPFAIAITAAPAQPKVELAPLSAHYHSGHPVDLTATATDAAADSSYRWEIQRADQNDFAAVDGTAATLQLTVEPALADARVRVVLVHGGADVAVSEPRTIEVDDHGQAPARTIVVSGLAASYAVDAPIRLSGAHDPATVLSRWQWLVQRADAVEPTVIDGQTSADAEFTATPDLDGATVIARVVGDDGSVYTESQPLLLTVGHTAETPDTELELIADKTDYKIGQTAKFTTKQTPATALSTYQWVSKAPAAAEFTPIAGATKADFSVKPTLALNGTQYAVRLLDGTRIHAESKPFTLKVTQLPATTVLTVTADKAAYAVGDAAQFTSAQNPQTSDEHYHWYLKKAGAADYVWVDQSRESTLSLPVTAAEDGASLVIRLFDHDHAVLAESTPVVLKVDAAPGQPVAPKLSIGGLAADGYYPGDTAELAVTAEPTTELDHWHWFIQRVGDADYTVVPGSSTAATLKHTVAAVDAGARVIARLYGDDHAVVAESQPVTLTVLDGQRKPGATPVARTGAELDGVDAGGVTLSASNVAAGSTVTIDLGAKAAGSWNAVWLFSTPQLLGGDWTAANADGRLAVTIPASTPAGAHRLAVFDAAGALVGWAALQVAATPAAAEQAIATEADRAALAATGVTASPYLAAALLLLLAGAAAVIVARRRRLGGSAQ
ncbi:hypothetical protein GCM10027515_09620 [Schumannella luteola]|uniref:Surface-anchored protein n=1 Tax=Schumannella luteola TaxID=472059 RepID=A0A852Y7Q1_9MICO|nr:choice-of-anchor M domain-containing protein [Schumannella luteola]NYG97410.1 surface-anchored protein [Schumannella luteola]TPX01655.1 hypothetical protein FJ656_26455 [Schumannella luteola]